MEMKRTIWFLSTYILSVLGNGHLRVLIYTFCHRLKSLSCYVLRENNDLPDELLYGRAGYLFSLLFLNSNISPPPIEDELIKQVSKYNELEFQFLVILLHYRINHVVIKKILYQVIAHIIKSGHIYSASRKYKTPLMYVWHDTEYIGGAHGLAGILYLLLQVWWPYRLKLYLRKFHSRKQRYKIFWCINLLVL